MPTKREQQLARARAARQAQRRQTRQQRNRLVAAILVGVLVLAVAGVVIGVVVSGGGSNTATVSPGTSATPTASAEPTASATPSLAAAGARPVACGAARQTLAKATRTFSVEPQITIDTAANYTMTLNTSCGAIVASLDAAAAPHTVNLLAFLANQSFYDGSFCHRVTSAASLTVLQCGDPTGTGSGSIGFTIAEENTKGAKYTRGTIAMAKTSAAHSTGSQFFLVDKDATLPADYTVVGHITTGLAVLDKLIAIGSDNANADGDGAPLKTIFLNSVTVTKS